MKSTKTWLVAIVCVAGLGLTACTRNVVELKQPSQKQGAHDDAQHAYKTW